MFFRIAINAGLLASTAGTFALLAGACLAGRTQAVVATGVFLAVNYIVSVIADWWPRVHFLGNWPLFRFVEGRDIWFKWPVADMLCLSAILLTTTLIGGIVWRKRDLPG